jgi:hypothetical protein
MFIEEALLENGLDQSFCSRRRQLTGVPVMRSREAGSFVAQRAGTQLASVATTKAAANIL